MSWEYLRPCIFRAKHTSLHKTAGVCRPPAYRQADECTIDIRPSGQLRTPASHVMISWPPLDTLHVASKNIAALLEGEHSAGTSPAGTAPLNRLACSTFLLCTPTVLHCDKQGTNPVIRTVGINERGCQPHGRAQIVSVVLTST